MRKYKCQYNDLGLYFGDRTPGRKHQGRKEGECVGDNFELKIRGIHFKVAFLFLRLVHPRFSVSLVLLVVSTLSSQSYQCVLGDFRLNSKHSSVTLLHSCSSVTQTYLKAPTLTCIKTGNLELISCL